MAILLILIAGKRAGSKRACVRQHTLKVLTFNVPDPAPAARTKKEKK
jgi:hypothetical protein